MMLTAIGPGSDAAIAVSVEESFKRRVVRDAAAL